MGAHEDTLSILAQFVAERDWDRFHTPANLAKSISIEAAELLEHYQWNDAGADVDEVRDELADVLTYCFLLASKMGWDVHEIIQSKLEKNEQKHPAAGSATPASRRPADLDAATPVERGDR